MNAPKLMGILNVTPDSFSDGGQHNAPPAAIARGVAMAEQGAAVIDVGGESTRPGSRRVSAAEQKSRVVDVIRGLSEALAPEHAGVVVSIDTTLAEVAEAAVDAGAAMLNDISAGREDPTMLELAAARRLPVCLMHMRGRPETMQDNPRYDDVVDDVLRFLSARVDAAVRAGVPEADIIVDPGIGFGKTTAHNLRLLHCLDRFVALGRPVLLGASRKRFISGVSVGREPRQRVAASCATTVLGCLAGVRYFRVHDVFELSLIHI